MSVKRFLVVASFVIFSIIILLGFFPIGSTDAAPAQAILEPSLLWQDGGCYASWCETGWYGSPAVGDLDDDGNMEVIGAGYSIVALDGVTGALEWRVQGGYDRSTDPGTVSSVGRSWPGVVLADVDGDEHLEIVSAHGGGYVSLYDEAGYFESGWPKQPNTNELRGLAAEDLDGDGSMEIIVSAAVFSKTNTWVYEPSGALRAGWPQLDNDSGYAWGVFNDNAAAGDLDGDGDGEVVVPSDVHYINAYEAGGVQIPANSIYGGDGWGAVGVWESLTTELVGYGSCDSADGRAERYRTNFAHGPAAIADLNSDGAMEVVVVGNVYDCGAPGPSLSSQYFGPYIFDPDRARFNDGTYNWESPPVDTGAPLTEDYGLIENVMPNPVIADLDGDGEREILFSSYDGRVHAFWLDKTEHGSWPYAVDDHTQEGFYRFASEPTVADLDNDGQAEVIFASWVEKGTNQTGKLHILDSQGNMVHEVELPAAFGSWDWNGALAAPTLANIDSDADLEVVLNTAHSGYVAYDLPGTADAKILWGTGRGSYQRQGYLPPSFDLFLPLILR